MDNITAIMSELSTTTFYPTTFNFSLFDNTTGLFDSDNVTTPVSHGGRGTPPPIGYYGDMRFTLYKTLLPIIISVGTVGNLLTVLVLLREWKTFSSTSMYLMVLAISDTCVLYTGPLRNMIKHYKKIDIRDQTDAGCKMSVYFTYACLQFSSWILVAVSVERAASVVIPHKVKLGCTLKTASIVIASLFITIFGLNIVNPVNFELQPKTCKPFKNYSDFFENEWMYIDFMLMFAVPFVILLFCNIIIVVHLQKSRAKRKRMMASQVQRGKTSGRDPTSLSILLIVLCVVFFLSLTPVSVFGLYYPIKYAEILVTDRTDPMKGWYDYQYLHYQRAVVNIVSYTNAALNFIMYVFSGTKFRNSLLALFINRKSDHDGIFRHAPNVKASSDTGTKSTRLTNIQSQELGENTAESAATITDQHL